MNSAKKGKRTGNRWLMTLVLILVLVVGLCVLLYPSVSNWWNERASTRAILSYDETVSGMSEEEIAVYLDAAEAYNAELATIGSYDAFLGDLPDGYEDILDITGTGIMGYITIEKIDVELPIYHGTEKSTLSSGAGHLEGSSLPVGGESTHAVISAHRGLPSALMFTRLDEMEVGDTFTITIFDQVLTYEVDQIAIVEPGEMEYLYIEDGKDYVTLMTCTPYGVNTQRLLVRGIRIDTADSTHIRVTAEANKLGTIPTALIEAIPLLVLWFLWMLFRTNRGEKKRERPDRRDQT